MDSPIIGTVGLDLHWPTIDPFLFCAHHRDDYPPGNAQMGIEPGALKGRDLGADFTLRDGWRMYHGRRIPGFPQHPHRGFETITIARSGFIDHSDSLGAQARFGRGDVQWMTAGRGVVHSEMFPLLSEHDRNPAELFQIWLNLPAAQKMVEPSFTMIWHEQIQTITHTEPGGSETKISVITGELDKTTGFATPPDSWAADKQNGVNIWRIQMGPGARWTLPSTSADRHRVLYAHTTHGILVAGHHFDAPRGIQLKPGHPVELVNGTTASELLLLEARPIREPVAQHGPFVMTTQEDLVTAFQDYKRDQFGGWPWKSDDPVLSRDTGRFARHADGRIERPNES